MKSLNLISLNAFSYNPSDISFRSVKSAQYFFTNTHNLLNQLHQGINNRWALQAV
jgi:hypothetical protein